jgi:FkbM family methyltransferase
MRGLFSPEYLFRPSQIVKRLSFKPRNGIIRLAWGAMIRASTDDAIGYVLATRGVYDLPLTEAILRLADPGGRCLDVGANIGYTALVMRRAVGNYGSVAAFEPNEEVLPLLQRNIRNLSIVVHPVALSDRDGEATLGQPTWYAGNCGTATLECATGGTRVTTRRLDSMISGPVDLLKIDVEGHEAHVLAGAEGLLRAGLVRDILFEEHLPFPVASHEILSKHDYRIFRLSRSFWKPLLLSPIEPGKPNEPQNFLATREPGRALQRFARFGWETLKPHRQ